MPLSTSYDAEASLIRLVGEGEVSMEDRRKSVNDLLANSGYHNESDILVDVGRVTNAPAEMEYVQVANLVRLLHSRFSGRVAIVNTRMGHLTVSHLVAMSADFDQTFARVFYTESEALAWLDS